MAERPRIKLDAPPVVEVMCGVFFPAVPALDPVAVGGWWHQIRDEYPRHAIQPAISDGPLPVSLGVRSWLVSENDEWVIQVQNDRFYVNWRKRVGAYPRFSEAGGVCERVLCELKRFQEYCDNELKFQVAPVTVELAKVDLIVQDTHWRDVEDLGKLLPVIRDISRFASSAELELGMNLVDPRPTGLVHIALSMATEALPDGKFARAVKIETRCRARATASTVADEFARLNVEANRVFFGLMNQDELRRFNGGLAPT